MSKNNIQLCFFFEETKTKLRKAIELAPAKIKSPQHTQSVQSECINFKLMQEISRSGNEIIIEQPVLSRVLYFIEQYA